MRLREAWCRTALCLGLSPEKSSTYTPGGGHRTGPALPASTFRQHLSLQGQQQEVAGGRTTLAGVWGQEGAKSARFPRPLLSLEKRAERKP